MICRRLPQVVARQFSTTTRRNQSEQAKKKLQKLKSLQEYFQKEDDVPVHLKGTYDGLLYRATTVLVAGGVIWNLVELYNLGTGK